MRTTRNAIELLKKEYGGAFRPTGQSNAPSGGSDIDAACVERGQGVRIGKDECLQGECRRVPDR